MEQTNAALVVIDMQNGFCHPNGSIPRTTGGSLAHLPDVVAAVREATDEARRLGFPVIYTAHCFLPGHADADRSTLRRFAGDPSHLIRGTWDAAVIDELAPQPGDHVVEKNRFDAFINTDFEALLGRLGVGHLVVTGVVTNTCVASTARAAWMRDYEVSVPEDTTTTGTEEAKQAALEELRRWFIDTAPAKEVLARLAE